jgi:hypothetical protein
MAVLTVYQDEAGVLAIGQTGNQWQENGFVVQDQLGTNTETAGPVTLALTGVSFSVVANDNIAPVTGTLGLSGVSFSVATHASPAGATGTLGLSGVSFSVATHASPAPATAILTLSGVSFAGSVARTETGAGTLSLKGVSFLSHVSREESATATLTLTGVALHAGTFNLSALSPLRQFSTFG